MTTFTYTKPTVGGSEDTWGDTLNANWDAIAAFIGPLDSTELAVLDGITASTAELNLLDGVTASTAELNSLDGVTSSTAELNLLDGVPLTTDLSYVDGVTSPIQAQINNVASVPSGAVFHFAASTAPVGYLAANGSAVSRTTYAALFAVIGTTFGVGDGASTFNLPDLRGEFVRGWDDGRGVDGGRVFGSAQADDNKEHYHFLLRNTIGAATTGLWNGAATDHITSVGSVSDSAYRLRASSSEPNVAASGNEGGSEARPRNVALLACIKV